MVKKDPERIGYLLHLAVCHIVNKTFTHAAEHLKDIIFKDNRNCGALVTLGYMHLEAAKSAPALTKASERAEHLKHATNYLNMAKD